MESLGAVTRPKGWYDHYRPPQYARGIGRKANRADGIGSVWAGEQYSRTLSGSEIVRKVYSALALLMACAALFLCLSGCAGTSTKAAKSFKIPIWATRSPRCDPFSVGRLVPVI